MPGYFRRSAPHRDPYPTDIVINGVGYMLGYADKDGTQLVSQRPPDQSLVIPSDYGYSAQNPRIGKVQPYGRFPFGYGLKTQLMSDSNQWRGSNRDGQYYYALGVDASVHPVVQGPEITSLTPATVDATNGIVKFYELNGVLYALNGRYALYRASDVTWSISHDFGSGNAGIDVEVFGPNSGTTTYAWVAMGDSTSFYYHDGATTTTTWTQHASLKALAFLHAGREFYRASNVNTLAKVDSNTDATNAANWTSDEEFQVGDQSGAVVRLALMVTGEVLTLKTDGIYNVDGSGQDHELFHNLRQGTSASNGKSYGVFGNSLYVTYNEGTYRIDPDLTITPVGPELLASNDSEVKGTITAFRGHASFCAYAGLYNPDTGNSYLMKFLRQDVDDAGKAVVVDAWHGALAKFTGKKITALDRSSIGAPSGHERMYIGFSDGSVAWFVLPCTNNPVACSVYRFSTTDGQLFLPAAHFGFPADQKSLHAVSTNSLNFSSSNYATYKYRTDPSASFTALAPTFAKVGVVENNFPNGLACSNLEQQVVLTATANTATPELVGLGVHHTVRPKLRLVHELRVLAENGLTKRDGSPLRIGADQIQTNIQLLAGSGAAVTAVFPDESSRQVEIGSDYQQTTAWSARTKQFHAAITVSATEVAVNATQGTHARLMQYVHASLEQYTHAQLEAL